MRHPASVGASIAGLLAAAPHISQNLTSAINGANTVPDEYEAAAAEISDVCSALRRLHPFILGMAKASKSRTSLIFVDQVTATLAATVIAFSELDSFPEELNSGEDERLMDRSRSTSPGERLQGQIQKLQLYKSSLDVMVAILTCQSTVEAVEKASQLPELVEQILEHNPRLTEGIEIDLWSYLRSNTTDSKIEMPPTDVDGSRFDSEATEEQGSAQSPVVQESRASQDSTSQHDSQNLAAENWAMMCRYFRDIAGGDSNTLTVLLCAGRPGPWSMVTGLTLSESSNIAILGLPIFRADLHNQDRDKFKSVDAPENSSLSQDQQQQTDKASRLQRESSPVQLKETAGKRDSGIVGHWRSASESRLMGVPIEESVKYAYCELPDKTSSGLSMRVPALLYHCCRRLEAEGCCVEKLFITNGHPVRVTELEAIFENPSRDHSKEFDWMGFTVHDTATLLLRYLKSLPEPLVPHSQYAQFTKEFRLLMERPPYCLIWDDMDRYASPEEVVEILARSTLVLPPMNRLILTWLWSLISNLAKESPRTMTPSGLIQNIFQPALLSRKPHEMNEEEFGLDNTFMSAFVTLWPHLISRYDLGLKEFTTYAVSSGL